MQEGENSLLLFLGGVRAAFGGELAGVKPLVKIIRGAVVAQKSRVLNISVARGFISNSGQNWLPRE